MEVTTLLVRRFNAEKDGGGWTLRYNAESDRVSCQHDGRGEYSRHNCKGR